MICRRDAVNLRRPARNLFRIALALSLILASDGNAVDKLDYIISDDITPAPQTGPKIAVQAGGDFVVTWVDRRSGRHEIFYQRFDKFGIFQGINGALARDSSPTERFQVALASNYLGKYSAVWKDFRNGTFPFSPDIYQNMLDSSGVTATSDINVTSTASDTIYDQPDIALLPNGSGIMVWSQHNGVHWDIVGRRFASDGSAPGGYFRVNDDIGLAQQHSPRVDVSTQGWYVITWYDNRAGDDDIYFQPYDSSGNTVGPNVLANSGMQSGRQTFSDVAADGSGRFTICWLDRGSAIDNSSSDIFARRFSADGTALDSAYKVNQDVGSNPQKEPAIATDRLGNAIIVWADFSGDSWDIFGQIINYTGERAGENFLVNVDTKGRQVQPQIALDGFDMRVVWADLRNDNFDIFGRIKNYNQPALIADPAALHFSMHTSGPAPPEQNTSLLNAGLGELQYQASENIPWLIVFPDSGSTPGAITVTISAASLAPGEYSGNVFLNELTGSDSATVLGISLSVTTSQINLSSDTIHFAALAEVGAPGARNLVISNSGSGTLFWRAEESISWLALSATDGAGNDTVSLQVDLATITTGDFQDIVIFHDTSANGGASDTLIVTLNYASGLPYILLSSDTVQVEMSAHSSGEVKVTVSNGGIGTLDWELTSLASWLSPITLSGSDNQEARLAVDAPTFGPGLYFGAALISDSAAFNSPETLMVAATFTPADTFSFGPASALPGDSIDLILSLSLRDPVRSITAPLVIDTAFFRFESLELMDPSALPFFTLSYTWDSTSGALRIDYRPTDSLSLAELAPRASREFLKLTLRAADFEFTLPTTQFLSADSIIFGYPSGYSFEPILQHSEVRVGLTTGVQPDDKPPLPEEFTLAQNYPNPFNLSTTISFFLPRSEEVELKIYNVLGRTIRTLLSGRAPAGWNSVQWDGRTADNFDAPSGVYFYRVTAGDLTLSRKALLLK